MVAFILICAAYAVACLFTAEAVLRQAEKQLDEVKFDLLRRDPKAQLILVALIMVFAPLVVVEAIGKMLFGNRS